MSYSLLPEVVAEAHKKFRTPAVEVVLEKLSSTELPMDSMAPPPRVHIAVLWLSKSDLTKFERELYGATIDWRDTLVAAGLANENWRAVLAAKGISASQW